MAYEPTLLAAEPRLKVGSFDCIEELVKARVLSSSTFDEATLSPAKRRKLEDPVPNECARERSPPDANERILLVGVPRLLCRFAISLSKQTIGSFKCHLVVGLGDEEDDNEDAANDHGRALRPPRGFEFFLVE